MKICIGIISYFPDDNEIKDKRIERLNNLLQQIDQLFRVPVIIVAQNWKELTLKQGQLRAPITIHSYKDRLGINKARKELRQKFIESEFDYMIMLDDDSQLKGRFEDAQIYLQQIIEHPNMWAAYKPALLKLFAISKEMYKLVEIPDGGADDEDESMRFFEDMYIIKSLEKNYPDRKFKFMLRSLTEDSDSAWDKFSTGWHSVYDSEGCWNRHNTGDQTRSLILQSTKETLLNPSMYDRTTSVSLDDYNNWWLEYRKGKFKHGN